MTSSKADPCLLFHRAPNSSGEEKTDFITVLQVDDSFEHGTKSFLESEEISSLRFDCNPRLIFNHNTSARFNVTTVKRTIQGYCGTTKIARKGIVIAT
jgi:hypothetical protein